MPVQLITTAGAYWSTYTLEFGKDVFPLSLSCGERLTRWADESVGEVRRHEF